MSRPREISTYRLLIVAASLLSIGLGIGVGCSQAARDRAKHFFFEVPDDTKADGSKQETPPVETSERPSLEMPPSAYASVHQPYTQKLCAECHDPAVKMPGLEHLNEACRKCHARYFSDAVAHSAVSDGDCLSCHQLHRSKLPSLLTQPAAELCAACHDDPADLSEEAHRVEGVEQCTLCHDPHFGREGEMLLKPDRRRPSEAS